MRLLPCWSERLDLNQRPIASKAITLARLSYSQMSDLLPVAVLQIRPRLLRPLELTVSVALAIGRGTRI
jgi:hypothetical protein